MLVDSHCHLNLLNLDPFEGSLDRVIAHMHEQDVSQAICISTVLSEVPAIAQIAKTYPNVYYSVGVHPNEQPGEPISAQALIDLAKAPKVVAIGETGLDYYRSEGDLQWQHERFWEHIQAAKHCQLPIVVHTRDAREDTLKVLSKAHQEGVNGVLHCFSEDWAMAKQAIEWGFYISFSGIVTFKNAQALKDVAQRLPLEWMLVETDSPWLAPTPHRGKPNFPGYVRQVAEHIAELRGESFEHIAHSTTANARKLFKLPEVVDA